MFLVPFMTPFENYSWITCGTLNVFTSCIPHGRFPESLKLDRLREWKTVMKMHEQKSSLKHDMFEGESWQYWEVYSVYSKLQQHAFIRMQMHSGMYTVYTYNWVSSSYARPMLSKWVCMCTEVLCFCLSACTHSKVMLCLYVFILYLASLQWLLKTTLSLSRVLSAPEGSVSLEQLFQSLSLASRWRQNEEACWPSKGLSNRVNDSVN